MMLEIVNVTQAGTTSHGMFGLTPAVNGIVVGLLLVLLAIVILWKLKQFIINSALGLMALFLLQFVGITIPVNLVTIIVSAVLGLIGVGLMVLLTVLGFKF
ncbi:MAG: pro-sigmaK processing inhibitor BofA family protein [Candidatus Micrarchaeota archaeon]|nr:pro-sigmaK processing inhibitor BofA family protein [Candidatus Micrarchaeota archaeon]